MIKLIKYLLICFALIFICTSETHADIINVKSCSQSDVQSAIDQAQDGDTIAVPAGTCTWSSTVSLPNTKSLSLIGDGIDSTIISINTNIGIGARCSWGKPHRISGFTFKNATVYGIQIRGTCSDFRVDHCKFLDFHIDADAVAFMSNIDIEGNIFGVVDNCIFTKSTGNFRAIIIFGHNDWTTPTLGTNNAVFIEDCIFDFGKIIDAGTGCIDSNRGARYVFRHNTCKNAGIKAHGICQARNNGTVSVEIYNNTIDFTSSAYRGIYHQGSGEALIFNNTFSGKSNLVNPIHLTYYRSCYGVGTDCAGEWASRCDGTQPIDGNTEPQATNFGWPCFHQPGVGPNGTYSPMYEWNNIWSDDGSNVNIVVSNPWSCSNPSPHDHIQENRDYFNDTTKSGYTPYPYPHPLTSESLTPPSNLRIDKVEG